MKSKEYWDKTFEDRFERQKMDPERPPLKVIIVPHSHNDPGWLKTFEHYFHYQSRQIMNHMVAKMQQYKNLTFIWSEVAFLNAWWEGAHPSKRRALKSLVKSGRLEITTGGWVMSDEANTHVYAMVDQMIEGNQWLLANLDVVPKSGWSIDPFGHGSTQPYILAESGFVGTVIQRVHYAWKQWLALKRFGDFRWIPAWTPAEAKSSILTHNQPFDIYSIKHSCGPHPYICLNFDFRKVPGEYTEYSLRAQPITEKNIQQKAELLMEQYAKTASLFPHNVALIPLGDDFRYNVVEEWDQQYSNYMKLIDYVNANKNVFKAEIGFGTPKDYFETIMQRYDQYPTLKGDFFVYSDIFSEGRPAYWSGYFTTRPFMKILGRELEANLRSAEIIFTYSLNVAKQKNALPHLKVLERDFEKLVEARRNLALFQHHDAITGTSKSFVMRDYGLKLFEGIRDTINIQQNAIQSVAFEEVTPQPDRSYLLSDVERDSFEKLPKKIPIVVKKEQNRQIVFFNSLAQPQDHVVNMRVNTPEVLVFDQHGHSVDYQINPVFNVSEGNTKMVIVNTEFELLFVARLPALSVVTYNITRAERDVSDKLSMVFCNKCNRRSDGQESNQILESIFKVKNTKVGDVQLENHKYKLLFEGVSGFLKSVTKKESKKVMQCGIHFGAYRSAQFHSGAYLFMPDPNESEEKDVLQQYKDKFSLIIISGPIASEISVLYGPFLVHSVRIYHIEDSPLSKGIYIENEIDFENPPKNRETELYMRFSTGVQNGEPPEMYTDLNGFQIQKRIKVDRIGIEGNYYPITTMAYIQDEETRVSILTNHAQGAASSQPGSLEVMLDRRTLYDDSRGMGEGLVDNRRTVYKFWLLLEDVLHTEKRDDVQVNRFEKADYVFEKDDIVRSFNQPTDTVQVKGKTEDFSRPSLFATHLSNSLNYPANLFIVDSENVETKVNSVVSLVSRQFPCDVHLMTLRTQPDVTYHQFPSSNALLVLHRQGYDCSVSASYGCAVDRFDDNVTFGVLSIKNLQSKTLTGTKTLAANLTSLSSVEIKPMMIQTYNVTFG